MPFDPVSYSLAKRGSAGLTAHRTAVPMDHPERSVSRQHLEYPTENVTFSYLLSIGKAVGAVYGRGTSTLWVDVAGFVTVDSFTDKRVLTALSVPGESVCCTGRRWDPVTMYFNHLYPNNATQDHLLRAMGGGYSITIASESVDIPANSIYVAQLQCAGSVQRSCRTDANPAGDVTSPSLAFKCIEAVTTYIPSGSYGVPSHRMASTPGLGEGWLLPPASELSPAVAVVETVVEGAGSGDDPYKPSMPSRLADPLQLNSVPDHVRLEAKRYQLLRSRGFTDDEIRLLLGRIPQHHVDLATVTYGVYGMDPVKSGMVVVVVKGGNPYSSRALEDAREHVLRLGGRVLRPPRDYREAVEQYNLLRLEHSEWLVGKDDYAYFTLGHGYLEPLAIADFYSGFLVDHKTEPQHRMLRSVPGWELERTIKSWLERLERYRPHLPPNEADKHEQKLRRVLSLGW